MDMSIFSKRLKHLMELEGISQRALSIKINVDRKSIRYWLNGEYFPKYDALIKIAGYFRVRLDYLMGLEDSIGNGNGNGLKIDDGFIEMVNLRFHQRLHDYLRNNCSTKYALAKKLNIDPKALTRWFTIGSVPEISTMIKLAQLMNISLQDFLLGD